MITLGRSAADQHVLVAAGELERRGVELHRASRGGDVTFHGPGQLVGYPVVRLDRGVVGHLRAMADGLAEVLGALGITAFWRREAPGLWIKDERAGAGAVSSSAAMYKICSFGVNVHRRVAIHGFALNVAVDLDAFRLIVPCGLDGVQMTSIERVLDLTRVPNSRVAGRGPHSRSAGRRCRVGILSLVRSLVRTRELRRGARKLRVGDRRDDRRSNLTFD